MSSNRFISGLRSAIASLCFAGTVSAGVAQAQTTEYRSFDEGFAQYQKGATKLSFVGDADFGFNWDTDSGTPSFSTTDVSLPGNFDLPVQIMRTRTRGILTTESRNEFGDWGIALPTMTYNWFTNEERFFNTNDQGWETRRCSSYAKLPKTGSNETYVGGSNTVVTAVKIASYHSGIRFNSFDGDSGILFEPRAGIAWPSGTRYATESMWAVSCVPKSGNMTGEGFVAHSPEGYKITFGHESRRTFWNGMPFFSMDIYEVTLRPTRIEDKSGNTVTFGYGPHGLTSVTASDGRSIQLVYGSNGKVDRITAAGRTWRYAYRNRPSGNAGEVMLASVTNPDGNAWAMSGFEALDGYFTNGRDAVDCEFISPGTVQPTLGGISLTNPYGAVLDLKVRPVMNGRIAARPRDHNGSPYWYTHRCMNSTVAVDYVFGSLAAVERGVTIGSDRAVWTYEYEEDRGEKLGSTQTIADVKTRTRRLPDGSYQTYEIDRHQNSSSEGQTLKVTTYASTGAIVKTDETDFTTPLYATGYVPGRSYWTNDLGQTNWRKESYPAHMSETRTTAKGDVYTVVQDVETDVSSLAFGRAKSVTKTASFLPNDQRVTAQTFVHNTSRWILGLPDVTTKNGRVELDLDYDSRGRVVTARKYGQVHSRFTYHMAPTSLGAVHTIRDALDREVVLDDWKAGSPQMIIHKDGTSVRQEVDANGWLTRKVDQKQQATNYQHDPMGRLTRIDPPGGYADTNVSYTFPSSGGLVQTVTKGPAKTISTYDGMLQNKLTEQHETATGWQSYINSRYDGLGRLVFKSQPSASPTETKGVDYKYDALGRQIETRETVAPYAKTRTVYASSNRVLNYDADDNATTTYLTGFDGPGEGLPYAIYEPDDVGLRITNIIRNDWDEVTKIVQRGKYVSSTNYAKRVDHYFVYDDEGRLCDSYTPEGGSRRMAYNAAGELTSYSEGHPRSTTCQAPVGDFLVTLDRDDMGRVTTKTFVNGGTNDHPIVTDYDANGNVLKVVKGWTEREFTYDELDNVLTDRSGFMHPNNTGERTLVNAYDANGFLDTRVGMSERTYDYTHDGFGRVLSLIGQDHLGSGTTALMSNAAYHPDGSLKWVNYGNGLARTRTLDARGFTNRDCVQTQGSTCAGYVAMDLAYAYTPRGRIQKVNDRVNPDQSRQYGYSKLGELVSAINGPNALTGSSAGGSWGDGTFTYDGIGNLTRKTMRRRTVTVGYDSRNRMNAWTDNGYWSTPGGAVVHDDRGAVTQLSGLQFMRDRDGRVIFALGAAGGDVNYTYDGFGKRMVVNHPGSDNDLMNVFDASGALAGIWHSGVASQDYTFVDHVRANGALVATVDYRPSANGGAGEWKTTWRHDDHLGSAQVGTDDSGLVTFQEYYTPFGEVENASPANADRAGFTGHIRDKATGLTYMQARYQHPVTGRFLSVDPVEFLDRPYPGQVNRYAYTWNDPINATDPDGEFLKPLATAFKIAKKTFKHKGNIKKAARETLQENVDAVATIVDPEATTMDKIGATATLVLGIGPKKKGACCFVAGTLVETENGLRPIEEIEVGDLVLARDPETNETGYKPVTDLIRQNERVIWDVTVADVDGTPLEAFETTDDHPWWIVTEIRQGENVTPVSLAGDTTQAAAGRWMRTDQLEPGMVVTTADRRRLRIAHVAETSVVLPTFNLTVGDFHTYFVGKQRVLVHNCKINRQQQAGHVPNTPQNKNRIAQGKPTSTFTDAQTADALTKDTVRTGTPVPGRPGLKDKEYGRHVGTGPNGGTQTKVRTHTNSKGESHGHPVGREYYD